MLLTHSVTVHPALAFAGPVRTYRLVTSQSRCDQGLARVGLGG